jgi:hypothetical protein
LKVLGDVGEEVGQEFAFASLRAQQVSHGSPCGGLAVVHEISIRGGRRAERPVAGAARWARPSLAWVVISVGEDADLVGEIRSGGVLWNAFVTDIECEAVLGFHACSAEDGSQGASGSPLLADHFAEIAWGYLKNQDGGIIFEFGGYRDTLWMIHQGLRHRGDQLCHGAGKIMRHRKSPRGSFD